jgi:hypothetical protein
MSPFANLFNKQLGNLVERYRISDAASESLFEQLLELKRPLDKLHANTRTKSIIASKAPNTKDDARRLVNTVSQNTYNTSLKPTKPASLASLQPEPPVIASTGTGLESPGNLRVINYLNTRLLSAQVIKKMKQQVGKTYSHFSGLKKVVQIGYAICLGIRSPGLH